MKKYSILLALALTLGSANVYGADFGDLLARLNSRDFSAERDVVTGKGGVYVGELVNPHSETPMFKARDEYRQMIFDALKAKDDAKIADLCAFAVDALYSLKLAKSAKYSVYKQQLSCVSGFYWLSEGLEECLARRLLLL